MHSTLRAFNLPNPQAERSRPRHHELWPWGQRLLAEARAAIWLSMLGLLVVLAMSLAFVQVVQGSVEQSAIRHKAAATRALAFRRCNALPNQAQSLMCHQHLKAADNDRTLPPHIPTDSQD